MTLPLSLILATTLPVSLQVTTQFGPPQPLTPLTSGMTIRGAGDLDGDGDRDLVVVGRGWVAFAEHVVGGQFDTPRQLVRTQGRFLILDDVDGDGDTDVVCDAVDQGTSRVAWLENDGGAGFTARVGSDELPSVVRAPRLGDRDGDGTTDLFLVLLDSPDSGTVASFELASPVGTPTAAAIGVRAEWIDVADVDLDGASDLVTLDGELRLWNGLDLSAAPTASVLLAPTAERLGDSIFENLNADGFVDVVVRTPAGPVVFPGTGTGFNPAVALTSAPADFHDLIDLDGDGNVDLLSLDVPPFPAPAVWTWTSANGALPFGPGRSLRVEGDLGVDVNGDGRPDQVFGTRYRPNAGSGDLFAGAIVPTRLTLDRPDDVVALDVDLDGRPELVASTIAQGFPFFRPFSVGFGGTPVALPALQVAAVPFDGIAVTEELPGLQPLLCVLEGSFSSSLDWFRVSAPGITEVEASGTPSATVSLATRLVSSNIYEPSGRPGAIVETPNGFQLWLAGPMAFQYELPGAARPPLPADLDRDGFLDLVEWNGSEVQVHRRQAPFGGFLGPSPLGGVADVTDLAATDFNGDGQTDIVVQTEMETLIFEGRGQFVFDPPRVLVSYALPSGATEGRQLDAVDLDGDGDLDLVVTPFNPVLNQGVMCLVNDGTGAVGEFIHVAAAGSIGASVQFADLDDDGDLDLFTEDPASESVSFILVENLTPGAIGDPACGPAVLNSTGASGTIQAFGSTSPVPGPLTLVARDLPPSTFGIFVGSRTLTAPVALGNSVGRLCLGGSVGRYDRPGEIGVTGTSGVLTLTIDAGALRSSTKVTPASSGDSWSFQAWFREPVAAFGPSNLTDAVTVRFD